MNFLKYAFTGPIGLGDTAAQGINQYAPAIGASVSNFFDKAILETILLIIGFMIVSKLLNRSL